MPDFTFGKRGERQGAGGGFELFLKYFDEGIHHVLPLEDNPANWTNVYEHFDFSMKLTFPCAIREGGPSCVGCSYPVANEEWSDLDTHFPGLPFNEQKDARKKADPGWGVRDIGRKWIFPCIDEKNYVSIYKISKDVQTKFEGAYKALGSVLQEFIIERSGKGFGTSVTVTAVPTPPRENKYDIPGDKEISEALGRSYAYALEKYGIDPDGGQQVPDPAPLPTEEQKEARAALTAKVQSGPAATDEAQAASSVSNAATPGFIPREASTGEIKDYLSSLTPAVEFAPKAARQTLVALAEKTLTERASGTWVGKNDEPPF